jgi:hypothetical protein
MQKPHYAEVPRKEPLHNFDVKQVIKPVDLEREHNRRHKLDFLTLRIKFIVPIGFLLVMLPLTIIMLALSVGRKVGDVDPATGVLQTISYISVSNPVIDIQPIGGSQICDLTGYEPGSLGTWRATNAGCYCPTLNTYEARVCLTSEASVCQNITATPETETFTWNGDRFCMKRLTNFIRTAGSCPSGYTKCGDLICVPSTGPCPITDVQIRASTAATPVGYQSRSLTFERKLVFANSATSNTQFVQFSYDTQSPCLNWNAFNTRTNGLSNVLEREDHAAGCLEFGVDAESSALDTRIESDYDIFNNLDTIYANVPGYTTTIAGSQVTVTGRYRFHTVLKDLCAQFYVTDIPQLVSNVEDFAYLYRGISISGVILSFITFCIALVYIRVLKRDGFWMLNREEPFGRRFIFQIVLLHCAYAVVTAIMGNLALNKISSQESYLKSIADNNCFDNQPLLNKAMDDFTSYLTNKIDGLVFLNNIIVFVAGGTTIAVLANLIFRDLRNYEKDPNK